MSFIKQKRIALFFIAAALLLIAAVVMGITVGSTRVAPAVVVRVMAAHLLPAVWHTDLSGISEAESAVVWYVRAPRVLVAALVGAALAVAGALMQGLFRNPLASPDITGTSSGAALGAVLALASGLAARTLFFLPLFSFIGALGALFLLYFLATSRGQTPIATLLLAGIALNALAGAATSFLITVAWVRYEVAQEMVFWLLGGLDSRSWAHFWMLLPCVLVGIFVSLIFARELDLLLAAGEETAASLGVEVERTKRMVLLTAALLTGAAVAVGGIIGFVGLVVPHIVRLLIGPAHRVLIAASALAGAIFLIGADTLARTVHRPEEIRLGIITAAFGAPFFLYLLRRHRREVGSL